MKLIIISGAPATGKTTIAKQLSHAFGYSIHSKDSIKEAIYESEQGARHGFLWYEERSKKKLFHEIEKSVSRDETIIIESNFIKADRPRLQSLIKGDVRTIEVYCFTRGFTRLIRFMKRSEDGARHKVYGDRKWYLTTFIESLLNYVGSSWPYSSTGITDKLLGVDTADFSKVNFKQITEFVERP